MAGYASDQFYNFQSYEGANKSITRKPDDNANFNYPGANTSPLFSVKTDDALKYTSKYIQRGFIRGIYPASLGKVSNTSASKVKQRRLFFQFNPTTLDRTVSMSTAVLSPLLQDPTNLLQPVPGSADFSFSILFNRESEVVSAEYSTNSRNNNGNFGKAKGTQITGDLKDYGGNVSQGDVSSLGVLEDLYILDSIIGQSITQDMVDFLKDYWNNASTLSQSSYEAGDGSASFSFDSTKFDTSVKKTLGNTAFLSPLPIRIVFSSLFMVEGFVNQSSVEFIKFSSNYVPTICRVTLGVRALYIGFAKEKAYLTDALDTAVAAQQAAIVADSALSIKMMALLKSGTYFNYKLDYTSMPRGNGEGYAISSGSANKYVIGHDGISNTRHSTSTKLATLTGGSAPYAFEDGISYSTFKLWWNTVRNYRDWYDTTIGGTLASSVSEPMKKATQDGATWTYNAKFDINITRPIGTSGNKTTSNIFSAPIKFSKKNGESHPNDAQDVANNANKKGPLDGNPNDDRWLASGIADTQEVLDSDSVSFVITHDYTLNYTGESGAQTLNYSYKSEYTFKANSNEDWAKINGTNATWRLYEITNK